MSPDGNDSNNGSFSAPYKTFDKVLEQLSVINQTPARKTTVYLMEGEYKIDKPIEITPEIVGNQKNEVKFKPYQNGNVVISGGRRITNWENHDTNIYKTEIDIENFRQVYVDGKKATRARQPNNCEYFRLSWDLENTTLNGSEQLNKTLDFENAENPIEIFIQKIWACQIFRVKSIDNVTNGLNLKLFNEDNFVFNERLYQIHEDQPYHLENSYEFLDSQDEWYFDKVNGVLYYYSDIMSIDDIDVVVPQLEQLLIIKGTENNKVHNVTFEGLNFEDTTWDLPSTEGLYAGQATYIYKYGRNQPVNGGIIVENAHNITFKKNVIKNMGGAGIMFISNVTNSAVTGNIVKQVSSNGIVIDWDLDDNTALPCNNILVDNNYITDVANDYFGAVGIFLGIAKNVVVEHNFLHYLPYTGISIGWGHTLEDVGIRNYKVRYNILDKVMYLTSDGAAIYSLSNQPGTKVHNNIIQNVNKSVWSGAHFASALYLDEGSNNMQVYENIFRNVQKGFVYHTEGMDNFVNEEPRNENLTINKAGITNEYLAKSAQHIHHDYCSFIEDRESPNAKVEIKPYPNPTNDLLKVSDINILLAKAVSYKIYNQYGKLLKSKSVESKKLTTNLEIQVVDLIPGVYIIDIEFDNYFGQSKFIKL